MLLYGSPCSPLDHTGRASPNADLRSRAEAAGGMSEFTVEPATLAAQGGHAADAAYGDVVPAIHPSTTFQRDADYQAHRVSHLQPECSYQW